jgi:hypothetical protein
MVIKLRSKNIGDYIHETVFMGVDKDHLQNSGVIVMHVGEWQIFGSLLLMGADRMKAIRQYQGVDYVDVEILQDGWSPGDSAKFGYGDSK